MSSGFVLMHDYGLLDEVGGGFSLTDLVGVGHPAFSIYCNINFSAYNPGI